MRSPTTDPKPLTPPDLERCQAEWKSGSFMTFGPRHMVRCEKAPIVIVTETKKDEHGRQGSMSLCQDCLEVFTGQAEPNSFTSMPVSAAHTGEA